MDYFKVANWETLQHYKDRNPPWIKLHNSLLDDYNFSCLQDASKMHLIAIMMLASRTNNKLPTDAAWLKHQISATSEVDIIPLVEAGFLELIESNHKVNNASTPLAERLQVASPETEQRQSREEGETEVISSHHKLGSGRKVNYSSEFQLFWETYPSHRRGNKKRAFANWKKIDPSLYSTITNHVELRKSRDSSWLREGGKFIIHAEGFLSGERWEDGWQESPGYSEKTAQTINNLQGVDLNG